MRFWSGRLVSFSICACNQNHFFSQNLPFTSSRNWQTKLRNNIRFTQSFLRVSSVSHSRDVTMARSNINHFTSFYFLFIFTIPCIYIKRQMLLITWTLQRQRFLSDWLSKNYVYSTSPLLKSLPWTGYLSRTLTAHTTDSLAVNRGPI